MTAKAAEIESKITDITNLANKVPPNIKTTTIENRIPDPTTLITTSEFHRLTEIRFDARRRQEVTNLQVKVKYTSLLNVAD